MLHVQICWDSGFDYFGCNHRIITSVYSGHVRRALLFAGEPEVRETSGTDISHPTVRSHERCLQEELESNTGIT